MNMLVWTSVVRTENPSSSHKSLWISEFLGTSQDQIQIMPRPVKFNTLHKTIHKVNSSLKSLQMPKNNGTNFKTERY